MSLLHDAWTFYWSHEAKIKQLVLLIPMKIQTFTSSKLEQQDRPSADCDISGRIMNKSFFGNNVTVNSTPVWTNYSIGTNVSFGQHPTSVVTKVSQPKTSKYQRILLALLDKRVLNDSQSINVKNETNMNGTKARGSSQKVIALTIPLILLGVFLTLVMLCHRIDTIRTRRGNRKRRTKASHGLKGSETEQAIEEVGQEANSMLLLERQRDTVQKLAQHQIGKLNYAMCDEIGQHNGRCMCRLERCAHCLGFEAKKLQWKDLIYHDIIKKDENNFDCKNASTQTWLPAHSKIKMVPQSSHKDGSLSIRAPTGARQFIVEADSVFGSEVSSKPHFPSSASNYTDSKTSDLLSSIREVSGSFYYSATSAQNASDFNENCSAGPSEKRSRLRNAKQRNLKKQFVSEAQLLSGEEDWI